MTWRWAIALLALLGSGCGASGDDARVAVAIIGEEDAPLKALGVSLDVADATVRASVAKGLVALDEEGRVVPGIAARWIVTDDGLSYIFRLNDVRWNDGTEASADDIARLLRERVAELERGRLGGDLERVEEIVSMTGRVIEVRLNGVTPNFLQLLAQPELGLLHEGRGAGPLVRTREADANGMWLEPLRFAIDETEQPVERDLGLSVHRSRAALALARYARGDVDIVLNGRFQDLPLLAAAEVGSGDVRFDPVSGLFGLRFRTANGFWANAGAREAVAMAIDRPALLTAFPGVGAWQEREKIVPEALDVDNVDTAPGWAALDLDERQDIARNRVAQWTAANGAPAPLRLYLPDGAGYRILFAHLAADLRAVGLTVERVSDRASADIVLIDQVAPYDSAGWFVAQLSCRAAEPCSPRADNMVAAGRASGNVTVKSRYFALAERELVETAVFVPLAVPLRWSLASPDRDGFAPNPRGWHPLHRLIGVAISEQ